MVRTRIAPSPTGMLHLGTARTALFSWAYARHCGGNFILRIEDTDLDRSTEAAVQVIYDSCAWLGLNYDEKPVRQTERLARYREVVEQLLKAGKAYHCYASREELDVMRAAQMERGEKARYDGRWRPENAAGKTPPEGVAPIIRFRNPDHGDVTWDDMVKGLITINNRELDDLVIMRADGVPTYNFAVVVDDVDMAMTHVMRGDDHVNNTPRQINLYQAMGAKVPRFGHLSMILGPDGKKLSKRHGAVSVMQYQHDGFLPEALFNYLARLGWSHGDDEKFSRDQLIAWFDGAHISNSPAMFDPKKLLWLNGEYLKEAENAYLARLLKPFIEREGGVLNDLDLIAVVALLKDRSQTLVELAKAAKVFYPAAAPTSALVADHITEENRVPLQQLRAKLEALTDWQRESIAAAIKAVVSETGVKMPKLAIPLRVILTGQTQTPSIDAVLEIFGRERVLAALKLV